MSKYCYLFLSISVSLLALSGCVIKPAAYVNPCIGNKSGQTFPGPVCPMGMVSASPFWKYPDRQKDSLISGFGQTHISGTGCSDAFGGPSIMPFSGNFIGDLSSIISTYNQETSKPGYYSVYLKNYNILAEATATLRSTRYRFTFNETSNEALILDLTKHLNNKFDSSSIQIISDNEIEGYMSEGAFCTAQTKLHKIYYVVKFSIPAVEKLLVSAGKISKSQSIKGKNIGACFFFSNKHEKTIEASIGISYVSIKNARENLSQEQKDKSFNTLCKESYNNWNTLLSRVEVRKGNNWSKTIFYTGIYHTLLTPCVWSDINGQYLTQHENQVQNSQFTRYSVLSLWDTYRNVSSFLTLLYPEYQHDIIMSMLGMYKESGWLPKWEHAGIETYNMNGDPAVPYIADALVKGLPDIDKDLAYEAMVKDATFPDTNRQERIRPGLETYIKYNGWIPNNLSGEVEFMNYQTMNSGGKRPKPPVWGTVSTSLEYNYADFSLSQVAKMLGKEDDYLTFSKRSLGYRNLLNPQYNLLCPRNADGSWHKPFSPIAVLGFGQNGGYVEGASWNYSFFVPHDIAGLKHLMGGDSAFVFQLNALFDSSYYSPANEPDINFPFLYNYAKGEEWRTQKTVRQLLASHYNNTERGIPGEEDCGTMSAWAVFSMMGFYPVCPTSNEYALLTPSFKKVILHLPNGKKFSIVSDKNPSDSLFINTIQLNKQLTIRYFIQHNDLINGGKLDLNLKKR
jgi:predicted alpha-1,2-mannosidase